MDVLLTRKRHKGDGKSIYQTHLYYKVLLLTRMRRNPLRLYTVVRVRTDHARDSHTPSGLEWRVESQKNTSVVLVPIVPFGR